MNIKNRNNRPSVNKFLSGTLFAMPIISQYSANIAKANPPQNNDSTNSSIFSSAFPYLKYFFVDLIYAGIVTSFVKLYKNFIGKEGQKPLNNKNKMYPKYNEASVEQQRVHHAEDIFVYSENRDQCYRLIDDNSIYSPHISKALSYALLKDKVKDGAVFIQYGKDKREQIKRIIEEGEALKKDIAETFSNLSKSQNSGYNLLQEENRDTFKILKEQLTKVAGIKKPSNNQIYYLNHIVLCIDKLYYLHTRLNDLWDKLGKKDIDKDKDVERQYSVYAAVYAEVIEELKGYAESLGQEVWNFCVDLVNNREIEIFGTERAENELYKKLFGICEYYRRIDDFRQNEVEDNENFKVIEVNNDILKENIEENQYVFLGNNGYEFGINNDDDNINNDNNKAAIDDLPALEDIEKGNQFNNYHYGSASAYQNLGGEVEVGYPDENEL